MDEKKIEQLACLFFEANYSSKVQRITSFAEGVASVNFRIQGAGQDILVRCDLRRTIDGVYEDLIFQNAARENGVCVPPGPLIGNMLNNYAFTGRPFIPGEILSKYTSASNEKLREIGRILSNIHGASTHSTRPFFYSFVFEKENERWEEIKFHASRHPSIEYSELSQKLIFSVQEQSEKIESVLSDGSKGIGHGDFGFKNMVLSSEDIYILDWEKAYSGYRIIDLGFALFYLLTNPYLNVNLSSLDSFFEGYSPISMLNPSEQLAIPNALSLAASSFFLLDITFAAQNLNASTEKYSDRRQRHFLNFCVPSFQKYKDNEYSIREYLQNYLNPRN